MDGSPALAPPGSVESVSTLDTPSLLVDLDRLERNIARWQLAADAAGVHLRPHIKTHKSVALAAMQRDAGAHGIAVAKVGEAEVFADAGFDDIAIAYPVVGETKWQRIARLAEHAKITLNVDSAAAAEGISAAASAAEVTVHLQIDLDSGFGRCGVPAGNAGAQITLARLIDELPGVELDGVTTHRGLFFPGAAEMSREVAGAHEGQIVVAAAERLRAAGFEVREVTAGGSLTGAGVATVDGVTEVRAGTYVFNDLMQIALGQRRTTISRSPSSRPWSPSPARTPPRSTAAARRSPATPAWSAAAASSCAASPSASSATSSSSA